MNVDLAFAALPEAIEQRVRIAASLLAGRGLAVRPRSWDGRRCDVAVVVLPDAYAERVVELANKRGTPVLAFSEQPGLALARVLPANAAAAAIAGALATIVGDGAQAQQAPGSIAGAANGAESGAAIAASVAPGTLESPALVRLATDDNLRGGEVVGEVDGRRVLLDCSRGRARASTLSDLLAARDRIASPGWSLRRQVGHYAPNAYGEVSMSLESFYVVGATHANRPLPRYPRASYRLRDWPDLGAAPEAIGALRVAKVLFARGGRSDQLASSTGVAEPVVDAALWAFAASGLLTSELTDVGPASNTAASSVAPGLFRRLAERFGLARR